MKWGRGGREGGNGRACHALVETVARAAAAPTANGVPAVDDLVEGGEAPEAPRERAKRGARWGGGRAMWVGREQERLEIRERGGGGRSDGEGGIDVQRRDW